MSRKRSLSEPATCETVLVDTTNLHSQQQQQQMKRACGTAIHPAPGELSSEEVASYLHGMSSHLNSSQMQQAQVVLDSAGWQSFAELNILLDRCLLVSGALPDKLLLDYSRFTLQARAQLWLRYSQYAAAKAKLTTQQLDLLRFLLEWVLAPYPDCALTEVTLQLPPFMISWASRWGMASSSGNRVKLIRLEAYTPLEPGQKANMACRKPAAVLYMPALL